MELIFRDIQNVVKKHFPNSEFNTTNVLKWVRGTNHLVYIIEVEKNKYVLKTDYRTIEGFNREIWAYQNFKNWYIPCPKLYFYDDSKDIHPYPYMILEFIEGEHPEKGDKESLISMINLGLPIVHSVEIEGFGKINDGKGKNKSWNEFISNRFEKSFPNIKKNKLLDEELLKKIKKLYKLMEHSLNLKKGKLLLGDLSQNNFFCKNNKFYKFIDFEGVLSGDPLWNYATLFFFENIFVWPDSIPNTQTNLRLYYFYLMIISLWRLWYHHINGGYKENDVEMIKESVSKLNMLIQIDLPQ